MCRCCHGSRSPKSGRVSRQKRYTQAFHDRNAAAKFDRVMKIAPKLPKIHAEVVSRMGSGSDRDRDAAAIASVILETGLRPTDSAESVKHGHFGIASLQARHCKIVGDTIKLDFIGKEGVRNTATIRNPANVARLKTLLSGKSGKDKVFSANSTDAIKVLQESSVKVGGPKAIKLKDLRTVKATQLAEAIAKSFRPPEMTGNEKKDERAIERAILEMSGMVANMLNNTARQARDNYIHPEVFKKWRRKIPIFDPAKAKKNKSKSPRKKIKS